MPGITREQTLAFSKVWDSGGIKVLFDGSSIQFATDWANIVLKSFIQDMKSAHEKAVSANAEKAAPAETPQKSSIILTD